MAEPTYLVPTKPDAEIAEDLKRDLIAAYQPVIAVLERGRAASFICNVQIGSPGPHAPIAIASLQIMKQF